MKTDMTLFEDYEIRRIYDEDAEIWWFSVIDIIQVLTQQPEYQMARNYWKVLKNRLAREGSEVVTNCNRLTGLVIFHMTQHTLHKGIYGTVEKMHGPDFNVTELGNINLSKLNA